MKRVLFLIITTISLLTLSNNHAFSQGQNTTQGKEFWVSFGNNNNRAANTTGNTEITLQVRIVATKTSTVTFTFTNITGTGKTVTYNINAGDVLTHRLTVDQKIAVYSNATGTSNKSLFISSTEPISVFAINLSAATTDATHVLPVTSYGQAYHHISYRAAPNGAGTGDGYTVIAHENGTIIQDLGSGPVTITLNKGQVYSRYFGDTDQTGRQVTANKPFAFFTTNSCVQVPTGTTACDCLFEQISPIHSWGTTFLVPVSHRNRERVRIVASQNSTTVSYQNGISSSATTTLNAGQFVEYEAQLSFNGSYITANKPVAVASYLVGTSSAGLSDATGDPALAWVPPIEQTVMDVAISPFFATGSSVLNATKHYALIVTPTATKNNTTLVIGTNSPQSLPSGSWRDNSLSGYSFFSYNMTQNAPYYFENAAGISVMGYGLGNAESYYYLAASSSRQLNPAFYINDIHFQDADGQTYCNTPFTFRAVAQLQLNSNPGFLKWYIDGVEEIAARDQMQWTKPSLSLNTPHEIKMAVTDIYNQVFTLTSTITVVDPQPLQISGTANICPPATSVVLTATAGPGRYQWYKDGSPILGATQNTYTATAAGNYGVVGFYGTCETTMSTLFKVSLGCAKAIPDTVLVMVNGEALIDVKANDEIPSECSAVTPTVTTSALHGSTSAVGDKILYRPDNDYTGNDSFVYTYICSGTTCTANVYIIVQPYPDNITDAECVLNPESKTFSIKEAVNFINAHTMSTPLVADLDGDGSPEIIVPRMVNTSQPWYSNGFVIANVMANSRREIATINFATHGQSVAIADVDNDGIAEIFVQSADDSRIYCYNPLGAGSAKAGFTTTVATGAHNIISIADINNDGIPELIAGAYIFNARTGATLLQMALEPDGTAFGNPHSMPLTVPAAGIPVYSGYYFMPVVGDVDGDGKLEIAAGSTIYKPNITNPTNQTGNTYTKKKVNTAGQPSTFRNYLDGPTVLVDFDKDGLLDVCVLGYSATKPTAQNTNVTVNFYAWNPRTQQVIGHSANTISAASFTIPYVGDLDGDGYPDFAFATTNNTVGMTSYQYDNLESTKVKQGQFRTDFAETAGFTLFDFNQDGKTEIVYRGVTTFYIADGATLTNISPTISAFSGTVAEYPIVADVDNDGQAEIILTRAHAQWNGSNMQGVLSVYKTDDPSQPWAPARKVWNQWPYNAVYINEDMTVPKYAINPATKFAGVDNILGNADDIQPYNGFLMQQTTLGTNGLPVFLTPDAVIYPSLTTTSVSGNSVTVTAGFVNKGDAPIGPPVYVTLYKNTLNPANIMVTGSANIQVLPGDTGYVSVTIPDITLFNPVNIIVRINDNGTKFPYQPECDSLNNEMVIINPSINNMMKKNATLNGVQENGSYPNPVSILFNEIVTYQISAVNANLSSGTSLIIRDTLPPYMDFVSSVPAITSTSNGGTPTREALEWTITNLASMATTSVSVQATPHAGVSSSQPLFINQAWVTVSDTITVPTNSTYHQGAGISITTFSAGFGGHIYNAGEQALDYMTSPRAGIVIVPEEGYRFAGWSHDDYASLRGKNIEAKTGIMNYDTLIIYGNVELHANFEIERYPVRYRLNGGNNAKNNPETYSIESGMITLDAPVKDNDVFIGWTGSNGEEPQHDVIISQGTTGELEYYANFLNSGRENEAKKDDLTEDKIWAAKDELFVRTSKAGSVIRIYSAEGVLQKVQTIVTAGETKIKLTGGIYFITLNNRPGQTVRIE